MFIFHRLKINQNFHEFILEIGTVANKNIYENYSFKNPPTFCNKTFFHILLQDILLWKIHVHNLSPLWAAERGGKRSFIQKTVREIWLRRRKRY
jgi:hypothetical protein